MKMWRVIQALHIKHIGRINERHTIWTTIFYPLRDKRRNENISDRNIFRCFVFWLATYILSVLFRVWQQYNHTLPRYSSGAHIWHGPLTRYVKLLVPHAAGKAITFSQSTQVGDPNIHHITWFTHVPWCLPGSLTSGFLRSRRRGKQPGIPRACTTRNFIYLVRGPWLIPQMMMLRNKAQLRQARHTKYHELAMRRSTGKGYANKG